MTYEIRRARLDDSPALARLSSETFGYSLADYPTADPNGHGKSAFVAVADGEIVACVVERRYESWYWGVRVPTAGIASVKVAVEHRGGGLLTPLFREALGAAVADGVAWSTLFPTAPAIYRRFGYETFGALDDETVLPTAALAQVRRPEGSLRRATVQDFSTVRALHDQWASAFNGPLVRSGVSFPSTDEQLHERLPGTTLALDGDGTPVGYAFWERTDGYDSGGVLRVHELCGVTEQGVRLLAHNLGTSATVAPTTVLTTSAGDLLDLVMPSADRTVRRTYPYMGAVLDVAGLLEARPYPPVIAAELAFAVDGLFCDDQDGSYVLSVADGRGSVASVPAAPVAHFSARGLALRYAGTHSCAALRRAGMLTGPESDDEVWDLLFSGRQVQLRDYF